MTRLLRLLLRTFPGPFRKAFGSDLIEMIETDRRRARTQGRLVAARVVVRAAVDLALSGVKERVRPTWRPPGEAVRQGTRGGMMTGWGKDIALAVRSLRRAPGFALVTVLTLGVAIGAAAGIFNVVEIVLLDPLPYASPDRLVHIRASAPGSDFPDEFGLGPEFYIQYRDEASHLENLAMYNSFTQTVRTDDRVERVRVAFTTPSLFETLGATPILGRLPTREDESGVFVMSHAMWTNWFGQDPEVIGRAYVVAEESRTAVGVVGPEFRFPNDAVLAWIPMALSADNVRPGTFGANMLARTAPGVTMEELSAQLDAVARRLPERFGGSPAYARIIGQLRSVVRPLRDDIVGPVARPLWVLMGSVAILFLIACANSANLFLVRSERHQRDAAVRQALGAGQGRIMRGHLTESALIGGLAGAAGVLMAWIGIPFLLEAAPRDIPRADQVALDGATLAFVALLALVAAVACGTVPALRASRASFRNLREAGRGTTRRWGRNGLVTAQTALALVLLVGSGLLLRSFRALNAVDPGYETEDLFSFQIAPEEDHLSDAQTFARFHVDMMRRLEALPGVQSVGLVENLPLDEGTGGARFAREGEVPTEGQGTLLDFTFAGGDYFSTMGIALMSGRVFGPGDHADEIGNVIVSQAAADALWPGEDPLGRRIWQAISGDPVEEAVIGVVENVRQSSFREESDPLIYRPMVGATPTRWVLGSPAYVVKTSRASRIGPEIRALVSEVSPSAPMYRAYTMEGLAAQSMAALSFTMFVLSVAASLSLALGAIGLYGVLSYLVAQRTQEIGVRMTLGARASEVRSMVVAQGTRVVLAGVAVGLLLAVVAARGLASLLFAVEPFDPSTFALTALLMLAIGFLASYLPARRASSVDPVVALRSE